MNYRHIYHAGNFADVLKHAVLARLVTYMKGKDKAFRVIDTHAGIGLYDLSSTEAQKTGEWREGIGRLLRAELDPAAAELLSPYLDAVRALNDGDSLERYPGSPQLTRMLMRKQDRLSAIELHPQDAEALRALFDGDYQTRVLAIDGWLALGAHVPPKEKRGIMLVDPPFEESGEFDRLVDGLARAWRRWPGGTYCLWYPLKDGAPTGQFHNRLEALGIPRIYCAELCVRDVAPGVGLAGSGVIVVNPPYTLEAEMRVVLPELCRILAQEDGAAQRSFWIAGETTVAN